MTAPGAPTSRIHGVYRLRSGSPIAVVTLSEFPPPPAGREYRAWALHGSVWTELGRPRLDATGHARLIAEGPRLAARPEAVELTAEPPGRRLVPSGPIVIAWPPR